MRSSSRPERGLMRPASGRALSTNIINCSFKRMKNLISEFCPRARARARARAFEEFFVFVFFFVLFSLYLGPLQSQHKRTINNILSLSVWARRGMAHNRIACCAIWNSRQTLDNQLLHPEAFLIHLAFMQISGDGSSHSNEPTTTRCSDSGVTPTSQPASHTIFAECW